MLARLCTAVVPGSSVRRVRRLRGGLDGIVHAVDLVTPAGERRAIGRVKTKVEPSSGTLVTRIEPPCRRRMSRTIDRPMPVPS